MTVDCILLTEHSFVHIKEECTSLHSLVPGPNTLDIPKGLLFVVLGDSRSALSVESDEGDSLPQTAIPSIVVSVISLLNRSSPRSYVAGLSFQSVLSTG